MTDIPPFDPAAGSPGYLYVKVADHLEARIRAGQFTAMLPGEQSLAEEYGVAIGTIRNAVSLLRQREVVVTLPGKGTYVKLPAGSS